jgi:hypothetical protein
LGRTSDSQAGLRLKPATGVQVLPCLDVICSESETGRSQKGVCWGRNYHLSDRPQFYLGFPMQISGIYGKRRFCCRRACRRAKCAAVSCFWSPFGVKTGSREPRFRCPLSARKRKSRDAGGTSALCQEETSRDIKTNRTAAPKQANICRYRLLQIHTSRLSSDPDATALTANEITDDSS